MLVHIQNSQERSSTFDIINSKGSFGLMGFHRIFVGFGLGSVDS